MSQPTENKAKYFTRGGQITFHNVRMLLQINGKVVHWCLLIQLLMMGLMLWATTPTDTLIAIVYVSAAKLLQCVHWTSYIFHFNWHGKTILLSPLAILKESYFTRQGIIFYVHFKMAALVSTVITIVMMTLFTMWLIKRGRAQTSSQFIRGAELAEPSVVAKAIKKQGRASDIVISGVPMIHRFEVQHTLIHGTVGAGKGQTFNQLLAHIKRRGDRAIIYDKGCVFTATFFDEKKDVILNPFDARCANWDLWKEALDGPDFENLAESLIPMHGETDPFWVNAARTIFGSAAYTMQADANRSIEQLLKLILTAELDELALYLKGTEAATLVSEKIEKTAISIRSVITTYLKSLRFMQGINTEGSPAFSIRDWVTDSTQHGFLFISSNAEQHAALRPLISMWLSMASISLLSLPENYDRRIWFICDELPTLHKLPQLPETIAEVRKFGGCFVLGMQSFAQLEKVYGRSAAKEMFDLLNTRFFFRSPSSEMAKLVSQELGEQEIDQSRENYSYGANTIRDGISVGNQRMTRPIVTASEVMDMEDLTAYLRVPAQVPVCKLKISYQERKKIAPGFIKRDIKTDSVIEDKIEAISGNAHKSTGASKTQGENTVEVQDSDLAEKNNLQHEGSEANFQAVAQTLFVSTRNESIFDIDREI